MTFIENSMIFIENSMWKKGDYVWYDRNNGGSSWSLLMNNELDINTLRQECAVGHIKWTAHILERMQERNIVSQVNK